MQSPSMIDSPSGGVPEKASRWDLSGTEIAAAEKVFRGLPWGFLIFSEFIVEELGQTELCGPHEAPGRGHLQGLLASSRSF